VNLAPYNADGCSLCGDTAKPTGEHKIKASLLHREVGDGVLHVGTRDVPGAKPRYAQSVNSKHLKFKSRLCEACNTARTQAADRAFEVLHNEARALLDAGGDPANVMQDERFRPGGPLHLDAFRYFAKLLACYMAEVGGPRLLSLTRFAIGASDHNRIWLRIRQDETYKLLNKELGVDQYAAHGGLGAHGDKSSGRPRAFESTLTLGPIQYKFWTNLVWTERLELRLRCGAFVRKCVARYKDSNNAASESPTSPTSSGSC
jgi:hypothetical protein